MLPSLFQILSDGPIPLIPLARKWSRDTGSSLTVTEIVDSYTAPLHLFHVLAVVFPNYRGNQATPPECLVMFSKLIVG